MHILVVHNRYRAASPSGENVVVDDEISQLGLAGHTVSPYLRSSDELDALPLHSKIRLAPSPIHSRQASRDISRLIVTRQPDVMHLHNPYPLVSMSVVRVAAAHRVPVVQTVHNYRHTCMKGTYERSGGPCRDCLTAGAPWPGVAHGCYRGSRPQSAVMAAALMRHRSTTDIIDRFISLSPAITESLVEAGVDPVRIRHKPNSVRDPGPPTPPGDGFAFVGRLSEEKGLLDLLAAWQQHPDGSLGALRIVGDGPLMPAVRHVAGTRRDIHVAGRLHPEGVQRLLQACATVVVPSRWEEPLGLVVLEAMAAGRPLLVTDRGALPMLVGPELGQVVSADVASLSRGLRAMVRDRGRLERMASAARKTYEAHYRPDVVTRQLLAIYNEVIDTEEAAR